MKTESAKGKKSRRSFNIKKKKKKKRKKTEVKKIEIKKTNIVVHVYNRQYYVDEI